MGAHERACHRASGLPPDQVALFDESMDALLAFAGERLGWHRPTPPSMHVRDWENLDASGRLLDEVWARRALLDELLASEQPRLDEAHVAVLQGWRHAVRGAFVCVRAFESHALYLGVEPGDERAFVVRGLRGPACAHVRATPSLVALTLLPFAGHIVTDGRVTHLSDELRPGMEAEVARMLEEALARDAVETADQLVAYERRHPDAGDLTRSLAQLAGMMARAAPRLTSR